MSYWRNSGARNSITGWEDELLDVLRNENRRSWTSESRDIEDAFKAAFRDDPRVRGCWGEA